MTNGTPDTAPPQTGRDADTDPEDEPEGTATARLLGYAGIIPFAALTFALFAMPEGTTAPLRTALIAYGAVILSFIGGIIWGIGLRLPDSPKTGAHSLYLYSIIPSLLGWIAVLLPVAVGTLVLAVSFVMALVHDRSLTRDGHLPDWFGAMRLHLTTALVLCLLVSLLAAY